MCRLAFLLTFLTGCLLSCQKGSEIISHSQIAFYSNRDGDFDIYVVNADGTGLSQLTERPGLESVWPVWSPDGSRIAFMGTTIDGAPEIMVMNANGTDEVRLTHNTVVDEVPVWSPDGTKIAFMSERDGDLELYVMNADGTGVTRLTNSPGFDGIPAWSPDGTRIAFERKLDDGNLDIYIVNADGTGQTRLTDDPGEDRNPSWSPDGRRILFERGRPRDIYVMNADGTEKRNLTDSPLVWESVPQWSPDGSRIAFMRVIPGPGQSPHGGNEEIHVMNADGSEVQRLTNDLSTDYWPKWRPGRQ